VLVVGSRIHVLLGVVLGLAVAAGVLYFRPGRPAAAGLASGPLLSECDGALRRVVIHCADEDDDVVLPIYRSFLPQLPADVEVQVVCPSEDVFQALRRQVGPTECRLTPLVVDHPITSWSRDRWLALRDPGGDGVTLLCPRA
jgi:hypothetical protein